MTNNRIVWMDTDNVFVVRKGTTTNAKIAPKGAKVVQTYTFSRAQVEHVRDCDRDGIKVTLKSFFALDASNCLDCPLSGNSGSGKCYTHKYMQFSGFLSMIRSIIKEPIPTRLDAEMRGAITKMCEGVYVRFGTYGEPSLLPIDLVGDMVLGASSWTGYTHQALKPWAQPFKAYYMASAHSDREAVSLTGWRSFVARDKSETSEAVVCPASKESDYASNCAKCGLCSGMAGKGRKNVQIQIH